MVLTLYDRFTSDMAILKIKEKATSSTPAKRWWVAGAKVPPAVIAPGALSVGAKQTWM